MSYRRKAFLRPACTSLILWFTTSCQPVTAQVATHVVISEIYGGGGNSGSVYTHDFVELYNPTSVPVVMEGWSIQYQSGGGSGAFPAVAAFSGSIPAHGYFLIQGSPGSGGSLPLPDPDVGASIALAASSGKIALVSDSLPVAGPSDSSVLDFVGYGSANLYEGAHAASSPGNVSSLERKASDASLPSTMEDGGADELSGNGWDSDDNGSDFILRSAPGPQNTTSEPEQPGGGIAVSAGYRHNWNLVSLPVATGEPDATLLFPGAGSPLYGYGGEYTVESRVERGRGYWLKFSFGDSVAFNGGEISTDTMLLEPGWNIIGSISRPVEVGSIIQIPEGHVVTAYYDYDGGYQAATVIVPGHGYWVKSGTGGKIILK